MAQLYVLFEHAVGYGLFKVDEFEEIGNFLPQVEDAIRDSSKFKKHVNLVGFRAFKNAATALANINAVSEGILTQDLEAFLEMNIPKSENKKGVSLGVCDPKLGAAINEALKIQILHTGMVPEVLRGIRLHLTHFIKGLNPASMKQSELGLGHSYSRGKVKFNIHKVDNMIIQSIALIDQLDKDINTFTMRVREWYSYHFPELAKVVTDNYNYVRCANYIKNRNDLNPEMVPELENITGDSAVVQAIFEVARMSMGMDISPIDLMNIEVFAKKIANLAEYRQNLATYLKSKMNDVAPNLSTLIGEVVGARLISQAGSLTNLAKYPASTVQILGAEKALFRALKTKSKTPKYGLIYHSTFIGRAGQKNKGRISRYLANKCSLASRIDCFSELPTNVFGEKLREQVEDRLKFYEIGDLPRKNIEVMTEAVQENEVALKSMMKKRKSMNSENTDENEPVKKKKKKKSMNSESVKEVETPVAKKKKKSLNSDIADENVVPNAGDEVVTKKKKKKKAKLENSLVEA